MTRPISVLLSAVLAVIAVGCAAGVDTSAPVPPADQRATEAPPADDAAEVPPDEPQIPEVPADEASGPAQLRAVWVHLFDDTLKTQAGIDAMLDTVATSGANAVIAEVVRRHDAYYRSDVLPRTTDPAVPDGFDPLAALVEGAHERGLELHAWVPLMPTYHATYADQPNPSGWVWSEHGPDAPEDDRWVTRMADGSWADYLDPAVPAVRTHLAAVVAELASDYPVDGVHLDYVRYTGLDAGYHPTALARFASDTGATQVPAPDDPAWSAWRRAQVTSLVTELATAVRAADPDVALTAAVIAQGQGPSDELPFTSTRGYVEYHQDWPTWLREGLLDGVMIMSYFDATRHGPWFTQWQTYAEALAREVEPVVAVGVGAWLNGVDASRRQLEAGATGSDGTVVYSYNQSVVSGPTDALLPHLGETLWAEPAPAPAWNDEDD